jgi:hypothetical protein
MGDFTSEKLLLFALFALPGAVAVRVYSLWCPVQQKDWKDSLVDSVLYSSVALVAWLLLAPEPVDRFVSEVFQRDESGNTWKPSEALIANRWSLLLFVFVTPAVLSSIWYLLRVHVFHKGIGTDHPTRTAWDWVFTRDTPFYILFHLKARGKDGKQVILAGYYNGYSFVTTYPLDSEIYVERVHEFRPDGTIGNPIPDTDGMLIKQSECEFIQFLLDRASSRPSVQLWAWERVKWFAMLCWYGAKGTPRGFVWVVVGCYGWTRRQVINQKGRMNRWRTRTPPEAVSPPVDLRPVEANSSPMVGSAQRADES